MRRPDGALPPGSTIGILGEGQLGRMAAMAAARLGFRTHIFGPDAEGPAMQVATRRSVASYDDLPALQAFAAAVDVVTLEFENVPVATLKALQPHVACHPGPEVLAICQDRLEEKRFLTTAGLPVAPWREVSSLRELYAALDEIGLPAVLKTTRLGYDGRGQAVLRDIADAAEAFTRLAPHPLVLEGFVPFVKELSVVVARGQDGAAAAYDVVENRHRHHILDLTFAPARVAPAVAAAAQALALSMAARLGLVGVAALELFMLPDGALLANEIAPRPHNSGHWTMDCCLVSQFEQQIRAVVGLPLGATVRHSDGVMRNLVGPEGLAALPRLLGHRDVALHWYGKNGARPGRKLGHANRPLPIGMVASGDESVLLAGV